MYTKYGANRLTIIQQNHVHFKYHFCSEQQGIAALPALYAIHSLRLLHVNVYFISYFALIWSAMQAHICFALHRVCYNGFTLGARTVN